MTFVLCYDISRARTRRKVARLLEERMVRVQRSVFEARMVTDSAVKLFDMVREYLDPDDKLRMYALSHDGLTHCRASGGTPLPEEGPYWIL